MPGFGSRKIVAPDLWGCGTRGPWPGPWPFRLSHDLDVVSEALEATGPCHLVGHSYGGALAMFAAARNPELVCSVALYESPLMGVLKRPPDAVVGGLTDPDLPLERWYEAFVDWWNGPGAWRRLPQASRDAQLAAGRECRGHVLDLVADQRGADHYAALRVPILLLAGTVSPGVIREALAALAGAHETATLRILDGLDHLAPVTRPGDVAPFVFAHVAAAEAR